MLLDDMIKYSECYREVIETELNKPLIRTKKTCRFWKIYYIREKPCEKDDVKVKVYDYTTGNYQGLVHQEYNLNLIVTKKISVVFHDFQKYDSHLMFQEVRKYNSKLNVTPKTTEKYMSFTTQQPKKNGINCGIPLVFINV